MSSHTSWSFKQSVGTEMIDEQTNIKRIWCYYQDKTIVRVQWQL